MGEWKRVGWGMIVGLFFLPGCGAISNPSSISAAAMIPGPTVPNPVLILTATSASISIHWKAASDAITAQSALLYEVYYTTEAPVIAKLTAAFVMSQWTSAGVPASGILSATVGGLQAETTYYVVVLVSNKAHGVSLYTVGEMATLAAVSSTSTVTETQTSDTVTSTATQTAIATDSSGPVPGNGGSLIATNIGTSTFTLAWSPATDTVVSATSLTYTVYQSAYSNVVNNLTNIELTPTDSFVAVGTLTGTTQGMHLGIANLTINTSYYFNVVASNGTYQTAYTQINPTLVPVDVGLSIPNGSITVSNVGTTTMTLSWEAATDTVVSTANLTYTLYQTTSTQINVVDNVTDITANSATVTAITTLTGTTSMVLTNLAANTSYSFNVVVGNGTIAKAYTQVQQPTYPAFVYLFPTNATPGNFGAGSSDVRGQADLFCKNNQRSGTGTCPTPNHIHAVFSPSVSDTIAAMPTTFTFGSAAVVKELQHFYQAASNWADLVSNGPCNSGTSSGSTCNSASSSAQSLQTVWGLGEAFYFWSGSVSGGIWGADYFCGSTGDHAGTPWATASGSYLGATGDLSHFGFSYPNWASWSPGVSGQYYCNDTREVLLCVCW